MKVYETSADVLPVQAVATGTTGAVVATLPALPGRTTYITGLSYQAVNPTAAINATVTLGNTATALSFLYPTLAAGAAVPNPDELTITFNPAIPSSAVNQTITVTASALGAGGVANLNVWGYQL